MRTGRYAFLTFYLVLAGQKDDWLIFTLMLVEINGLVRRGENRTKYHRSLFNYLEGLWRGMTVCLIFDSTSTRVKLENTSDHTANALMSTCFLTWECNYHRPSNFFFLNSCNLNLPPKTAIGKWGLRITKAGVKGRLGSANCWLTDQHQ